jgi:small GTP-binding protein
MENFDYKYKLVLIGNSDTGKTSLIARFITNNYKKNERTIGTDYSSKIIIMNDKKIKLSIWDTAGQERFADIIKVFYKDADAVIITFDITNYQSFVDINKWIAKIKNDAIKNPYIIIVATKIDMENCYNVDNFDISLFMTEENNNYDYMEVSSKNGTNVNNLFEIITENLLKKEKEKEKDKDKENNNNNNYVYLGNLNNNIKNYIPNLPYCSIM